MALGEGANTIGVTASDTAGNGSSASVVVNHEPGGVGGEAAATALGSIENVDTDPRHDEAEVSVTPEGMRIARTEIALRITQSATVAQVNGALASVTGQVVGSIDGSPQLAVGIPDPGSLTALDALLATLETRPGVERAGRADMPEVDELPTGFASPPSAAGGPILSHLLAMRMPAAWNARRAIDLADRPTLIVADLFGNGPLSGQVDATYNSADLSVLQVSNEHGYHVVGIAASGFATNGTAAGNVTGVFPATTPLHVIDGDRPVDPDDRAEDLPEGDEPDRARGGQHEPRLACDSPGRRGCALAAPTGDSSSRARPGSRTACSTRPRQATARGRPTGTAAGPRPPCARTSRTRSGSRCRR